MQERLDKCLAHHGIGSRTEVGKLIRAGRVTLDGNPVRKPDIKVDTDQAEIMVNGVRLDFRRFVYIMQNKPRGVISASRGGDDRPTVIDILPSDLKRKGLFPAGRLDAETTGFVLITDDGEFAHEILSPRRHVPKTYHVRTNLPPPEERLNAMREGILLGDNTRCKPAEVTELSPCEYRVVLREGRYHQIRRMFGAAGCRVIELHREQIGGLVMDINLREGESRLLTPAEKDRIKQTP